MTVNNHEQENHAAQVPKTDPPTQLTKEEMRAKIRASLAAREETESQTKSGQNRTAQTPRRQQIPVYAAKSASPAAAPKSQASTNSVASSVEHTRMEKTRQLRETLATQHERESADQTQQQQAATAQQRTAAHTGTSYSSHQDNMDYRESSSRRPQAPPQSQNRRSYPPRQPQYDRRDYRDYRSSAATTSLKKVLIISAIVLVLLLAAFYFGGLALYRDKFLPNTYINELNVSGMTQDEAESLLVNNAQEMGITFVTKSGEEIVFKGSSFGCTTTMPEGSLDEAWSESHGTWFTKIFAKSEYVVSLDQTYSDDALISLIAAYDWGNVAPTNAQVVQADDGSFYIEPEDDGNMVDTEILSDFTLEQLANGTTTINMALSGCYMTAEITSEDLEDTLDLYNQYADVVITFDMTNREEMFDPVGTEELDFDTFINWITFDSDGTLTLDKEAATEWVQTNIADQYDTFCEDGYSRTFESTMHETVTVTLTETSTYGWETDVEATVDVLEEYLQAGESITTEPEWIQAGFRPTRSDGTVFDEGTYIEVDICNQHLWFYVDGELYLDTDVVTGLASDPDRETHTGIFKIRDKQENAVLGTYEVQGYETPVSYWMPIDHTGIGLHDLSRSAYGGDIYLTNGSHGCINLPYSAAQAIYEKCVIGMPVIIVD